MTEDKQNSKSQIIDIQYLSNIEISATAESKITQQVKSSKESIIIEIPLTNKRLELSGDHLEKWLEPEIQNISTKRQLRIDTIMPCFSFQGTLPKSEFNTFVLVNLPYVFYLPNYFALNLNYPVKCRVKFIKRWTEKTKGSNTFDAISDKRLYFRNYDIKTPLLPLDTTSNANTSFTGKNIEKERDNNGEYRYSTLLIETDTCFGKDDFGNAQVILCQIKKIIREIAVYLTRIYKYCSEDFSIRFKEPTIIEILFPEKKLGFYVMDGTMIRDATINNTKEEINYFESLIKGGFEPSLDEILLMDAKSAFIAKEYKLAILEAFQAMDVFLEMFIHTGFTNKGLSKSDIDKKLEKTWKTRERAEKLLMDLFGKGLSQIDGKIGNKWHDSYVNVRNNMIHKGYQPSRDDTVNAINLNESAIALIKKQRITLP